MMVSDYEEMQPQLATKARNDGACPRANNLPNQEQDAENCLTGILCNFLLIQRSPHARLSDPLVFRLAL